MIVTGLNPSKEHELPRDVLRRLRHHVFDCVEANQSVVVAISPGQSVLDILEIFGSCPLSSTDASSSPGNPPDSSSPPRSLDPATPLVLISPYGPDLLAAALASRDWLSEGRMDYRHAAFTWPASLVVLPTLAAASSALTVALNTTPSIVLISEPALNCLSVSCLLSSWKTSLRNHSIVWTGNPLFCHVCLVAGGDDPVLCPRFSVLMWVYYCCRS